MRHDGSEPSARALIAALIDAGVIATETRDRWQAAGPVVYVVVVQRSGCLIVRPGDEIELTAEAEVRVLSRARASSG